MIIEIFTKIFSSSKRSVRALGYVDELIGINARYKRQDLIWENHLRNSKHFILKKVSTFAPVNHIVVIGSGSLLDLPLEELLKLTKKITLIDVAFLPKIKRKFKNHPKVELLELDITGLIEKVYAHKKNSPLPQLQIPKIPECDLVISLNLLSQLPLLPMEYLNTKDENFGRAIITSHLDFLKKTPRSLLLCENRQLYYDKKRQLIEDNDMLFGVSLPPWEDEWIWEISPLNEESRDYSIEGTVKAIFLDNTRA